MKVLEKRIMNKQEEGRVFFELIEKLRNFQNRIVNIECGITYVMSILNAEYPNIYTWRTAQIIDYVLKEFDVYINVMKSYCENNHETYRNGKQYVLYCETKDNIEKMMHDGLRKMEREREDLEVIIAQILTYITEQESWNSFYQLSLEIQLPEKILFEHICFFSTNESYVKVSTVNRGIQYFKSEWKNHITVYNEENVEMEEEKRVSIEIWGRTIICEKPLVSKKCIELEKESLKDLLMIEGLNGNAYSENDNIKKCQESEELQKCIDKFLNTDSRYTYE